MENLTPDASTGWNGFSQNADGAFHCCWEEIYSWVGFVSTLKVHYLRASELDQRSLPMWSELRESGHGEIQDFYLQFIAYKFPETFTVKMKRMSNEPNFDAARNHFTKNFSSILIVLIWRETNVCYFFRTDTLFKKNQFKLKQNTCFILHTVEK